MLFPSMHAATPTTVDRFVQALLVATILSFVVTVGFGLAVAL